LSFFISDSHFSRQLGFHGSKVREKEAIKMRKLRNVEWQNYQHPEFLQSLSLSVSELKYVRLFLKGGAASLVNKILRERKTRQFSNHRNNDLRNYSEPKKIKA